ncbi:glucosamine-6-phosphate deaminase [Enterobacter sp. CC120223-11]|uniref:glucosamine-6-phosphate deaminase n=1 Tax=Enterobacter sp. CC120223-11 TaxID=1378073 RepID=UPI000BDBB457|nr:glucosamine-6-phosphate deaminase [Enterobacter sp. CC120223-11]SNY61732.1 glucosamine-6-phosphate isomerase [Enterobacter sp. CC120223-11]
MKTSISSGYAELSKAVAQNVIDCVKAKPDALICIAGGDTPLGVFAALVEAQNQGRVDFSRTQFLGLDEWLGLGLADKGSCREMVWHHFFDKLTLREEQICFFDGLTHDPQAECKRVDGYIEKHGPIDCIVLGIGMNGHIGFNEPGASLENTCHVIDLDPVTQTVSVKYFGTPREVKQGISLGLKTILASKKIVLMASGEKKAAIVAQTVNHPTSVEIPSTLVKTVPQANLFVDKAAASAL